MIWNLNLVHTENTYPRLKNARKMKIASRAKLINFEIIFMVWMHEQQDLT